MADQHAALDHDAITQANRIGSAAPGHVSAALPSSAGLQGMTATEIHSNTSFMGAGQGSSDASLGMAGLGRTGLGLAFVIGLIFVCSALLKRFGPYRRIQGQALRIVASQAVGQKERVVVVEVDETWLVLGVAPGSVNMLHTLPAKSGNPHADRRDDASPTSRSAVSPPGFGEAFSDNLRRALSRFSRNDRKP